MNKVGLRGGRELNGWWGNLGFGPRNLLYLDLSCYSTVACENWLPLYPDFLTTGDNEHLDCVVSYSTDSL